MSDYALSEEAVADIEAISRTSIRNLGVARAERYVMELHEAFMRLSLFPNLGRDIGYLRRGYFRFEHESHVVFYTHTDTGIFIVRILHEKQQPKNYL